MHYGKRSSRQRPHDAANSSQAQSGASASRVLASQYGLNVKTVPKWRGRAVTTDAPMGPKPKSTVLSRRSRNQTGKAHPRPCGQILDDPPIHIRPVVPASAGAEGKNPAGSSHYGLPRLAPRIRDHKGFFAESVKSAAIRDYYVTQFAQPAIDAGGRSKGIVAGHEPGCVRVGYATLRWSSACGVVNVAAAPPGR
jgi:hypothetical protein